MYVSGLNLNINGIYPKVSYPVARETPSLLSIPLWDHIEQWPNIIYEVFNMLCTSHMKCIYFNKILDNLKNI